MKIRITDRQKLLKLPKTSIKRIVQEVIGLEKVICHEVSVHFISDNQMREMHGHYFNDPTSTDCISFPLDGPEEMHYRVLGEIFVCPETALKYTEQHGGDSYMETVLYIIHGLLHLIGYDDIKKSDRDAMRAAEKKHLNHLATLGLLSNPIPN
ncbi:rRNA maturation RNase YbeY [Parachlamydia sp. AcF125]|uniref:rRNA maturation RNase YbeY n=1 Tax=Parachlamydia sp. AcF125 TaxID=2795736 RepID=UPI001BC91E88|nr:Endoribonuclease YbeY [Parachlamydia sp. AcF125]